MAIPVSADSGADRYGWPSAPTGGSVSRNEQQQLIESLNRLSKDDLQLEHLATGQEHAVFTSTRPEMRDLVVKITRPGGYGILMDARKGESTIGWRRGSPREYLERVARQNRVFADTVQILGWISQPAETGADWPCIVSTQLFRAGEPPKSEEIAAYLLSHGLISVPAVAVTLSYLKEQVYYSPEHNLLVSDCRRANFVKAPEGLAVLDLIVQRPTGCLRHLLRQLLGHSFDIAQVRSELDQVCAALPVGRERNIRVAQIIEDLGGDDPTLASLRIAAVRYAQGESNHALEACLDAHARSSAGARVVSGIKQQSTE
jgi:hypothetical protein